MRLTLNLALTTILLTVLCCICFYFPTFLRIKPVFRSNPKLIEGETPDHNRSKPNLIKAETPGHKSSKPNLIKAETPGHNSSKSNLIEDKTPCFLYRVHFSGGLGNRLWQLLGTMGIAMNHSCYLTVYQPNLELLSGIFDMDVLHSFYPFSYFRNQSSLPVLPKGTTVFQAQDPYLYKPLVLDSHRFSSHVEVKGYFQNYRFLASTADEFGVMVLKSLVFLPDIVAEATTTLDEMSRCSNTTGEKIVKKFIGLHYRRFPDRHKFEPPPSANSTLHHMQTLLNECGTHESYSVQCADGMTLSTCCALVVSNDPVWTKSNLANLSCVRFVENEFLEEPFKKNDGQRQNGWATDFGRDMCILTMVDTLVTTTGTFGYYSAILHGKDEKNKGQVYAYRNATASKNGQNLGSWALWG